MEENQLKEHRVHINGVHLHVVTAGRESGRPVILLHGFPDFWYGWRHQIDTLVASGFRPIMPDQRGYGLSDKPHPKGAYHISQLSDDILALMNAFGLDRASLVGHDFGGGVAWWLAAHHPERVERMVVLNCPHFAVYRRAHLGLEQLLRSWYVFAFQVPLLAEQLLMLDDFGILKWFGPGRRAGGMRKSDIGPYRQAWSRPGAVRAMVTWYRAMLPAFFQSFSATRIIPPTLLLWGVRDPSLSISMAEPSVHFCDHGKLILMDEETHWLHWDAPERVNLHIIDWLNGKGDANMPAPPT